MQLEELEEFEELEEPGSSRRQAECKVKKVLVR